MTNFILEDTFDATAAKRAGTPPRSAGIILVADTEEPPFVRVDNMTIDEDSNSSNSKTVVAIDKSRTTEQLNDKISNGKVSNVSKEATPTGGANDASGVMIVSVHHTSQVNAGLRRIGSRTTIIATVALVMSVDGRGT